MSTPSEGEPTPGIEEDVKRIYSAFAGLAAVGAMEAHLGRSHDVDTLSRAMEINALYLSALIGLLIDNGVFSAADFRARLAHRAELALLDRTEANGWSVMGADAARLHFGQGSGE